MSDPVFIPQALWARVAKMLREHESGTKPQANHGRPAVTEDNNVVIKITAIAAGGGKYYAKLLQPGTADIAETGAVTEEELGDEFTPTDPTLKILALNAAEKGQSTHQLEIGSIHNARVRRRQSNGTLIVNVTPGGAPEDAGQYIGMTKQVVAQNVTGYDWLGTHGMLG